MDLYSILGLIGAVISIAIYAALQFELVSSKSISFSLFNFIGSILIGLSLIEYWNLGTFVIEVFWTTISLFGLIKAIINKNIEEINYEFKTNEK